jgi:hypothetical protein
MHVNLFLIAMMLVQWVAAVPGATLHNSAISVSDNQAQITFPEKITFSAQLQSETDIQDVALEYGVDELTCGKLVAKAFPDFKAGKNVSASWAWEMKQSGSLPTGAKIWWRWNVTDSGGNHQVTDTQTILWIDQVHPWKTLSAANLNLHYYQGDNSFGSDLLNTATASLVQLKQQIGLKPDGTIDLYIYANSDDLNQTIYFQPDWTGGLAFPEYNIVLIGIPADQMVWGRHAETHELTHVLVGHLTFSCLGSLPTWLNEGLAKYSEGDWDQESQTLLQNAIADDSIFSVRSLSSSFPEDATKANLAYSQSQSLVGFLIKEYNQDKMLALLNAMRQGATTDEALTQIYGFNQDGLEDAWRAKMGAKSRPDAQSTIEATPQPTPVATIVPISALPKQAEASPTASAEETANTPTEISEATPAAPADSGPGFPTHIGIIALICGGGLACLVLAAGIVVIVLIVIKNSSKEAKR